MKTRTSIHTVTRFAHLVKNIIIVLRTLLNTKCVLLMDICLFSPMVECIIDYVTVAWTGLSIRL